MGSKMVVLGPHLIPQRARFLLIHLFVHSFIQIAFIEHLLSVTPQGSEIVSHRTCCEGAHSLVRETVALWRVLSQKRLWSAGADKAPDLVEEVRTGFPELVVAKLTPEGCLKNKPGDIGRGHQP